MSEEQGDAGHAGASAPVLCAWCEQQQDALLRLVICEGCGCARQCNVQPPPRNLGPLCTACYDSLHGTPQMCPEGRCKPFWESPTCDTPDCGAAAVLCCTCRKVLCLRCSHTLHSTGNQQYAGHDLIQLAVVSPLGGGGEMAGKSLFCSYCC
jgi:hypothetical protein